MMKLLFFLIVASLRKSVESTCEEGWDELPRKHIDPSIKNFTVCLKWFNYTWTFDPKTNVADNSPPENCRQLDAYLGSISSQEDIAWAKKQSNEGPVITSGTKVEKCPKKIDKSIPECSDLKTMFKWADPFTNTDILVQSNFCSGEPNGLMNPPEACLQLYKNNGNFCFNDFPCLNASAELKFDGDWNRIWRQEIKGYFCVKQSMEFLGADE